MVCDVQKSKTRRDYLFLKVIEEFARIAISERIRHNIIFLTSWIVHFRGILKKNDQIYGRYLGQSVIAFLTRWYNCGLDFNVIYVRVNVHVFKKFDYE